jgi:hypothetical protein
MTTPKRLTISISQIAPLVGLDAYNNFPRIICEIWRKYNPSDFKIFEAKLKEQGQQISTSSEMNDIWEADEALGTNILQQVKDINSNKDKTSGDMVSQQDVITKYINNNEKLSNLDNKQKEDLAKKVCSVTNKMHGVINEDSILDEFCRLSEKTIKNTQDWLEIPINNRNLEKVESSELSSNPLPINWILVGKYDAITNDNELVEAKMRQKALFKKVRDYENVQVQLYLHALKFEKAFLVESYTNKKGVRNMYVNEINYDESYVVDTVLERIVKFIEFFEIMMSNDDYKVGLLNGDKNRKIYKIYENEFLGIEKLDF